MAQANISNEFRFTDSVERQLVRKMAAEQRSAGLQGSHGLRRFASAVNSIVNEVSAGMHNIGQDRYS